jgi:hypothetical protein
VLNDNRRKRRRLSASIPSEDEHVLGEDLAIRQQGVTLVECMSFNRGWNFGLMTIMAQWGGIGFRFAVASEKHLGPHSSWILW